MFALQVMLLAGVLGAESEAVLLSFTQPGCGPCKTMEPVLAKLEQAGMPIQPINVEQHPEYARRFNITGTPTFVVLVGDKEAGRIVGATTAERLTALFPITQAPPVGDLRGQSPVPTSSAAPSGDPFLRAAPKLSAASPAATSASTSDPQARAMAAAVRLKVIDAQGQSIGSGTIIDVHGDEALVVTCGHIFRESQGKGKVAVDVFHPTPRTLEGKLVDFDLKRDIALVSITPGAGAIAAPVAPTGTNTRKADTAFSIGCDKGDDPTLRPTRISGLNRYQGPPNIEAQGQPVDGRSGGGLFSAEGYLIGVCNAADPADDEGIYAALETIHWQLNRVGLDELSQPRATQPATEAIVEARPVAAPAVASIAPVSAETLDSDAEVICIVRSKGRPSAKGQVIVIPKASQVLLKQLAADAADPTAAADLAALTADRRSSAVPELGGPVVRGQSRR
jgi:thiol-disulfide isomerase/thioredoxin